MFAQVMGVLNVTPDSFSDGGDHILVDAAVRRGQAMLAEGASVIDVGGESTRPGAAPVDPSAQRDRVVPVIQALAPFVEAANARISIDTRDEFVARAACAAGATLINDISSSLEGVAADLGVGWLAMHMQGDPTTMQASPTYHDVVAEVLSFLLDAAKRGSAAGVQEIWIDPGIGFGKTEAHNWSLLANLDRFVDTGIPVCVGTSRKGFLGTVLSRSDGTEATPPPDDRLEASMTTATWAATMGAQMIRVHDVRATAQAVIVAGASRPDAVVALDRAEVS